jgi:two-component system CheB/CheR fusion protein
MSEHERTEAEDIVRAIRQGEVDAFVVRESDEDRIYSLRSADVLYRAMIEQMKDGAVALDSAGLIVYCNASFAQLVKAERGALIGTKILRFVPAERDGDGFFESLGDPARNGAMREIELRTTDGTTLPAMAAMNRIAVDKDTHVYCLIVTDLTEQRRRDQLLNEGRRKDEFLAMLAHELRNPIAPIRYAAARLRTKDPTPDRLEWARNVIDRQVDHLTRLIDDLLDVSRISRGRVSLNTEPVEVDAIVARAVEAARPMIEERKQELTISRPGKRLRVNGDATRLAQVISNLLNNASKFTREGGRLGVEVDVEAGASSWVRIVVSDEGAGIDPAALPEMFNLFVQADSTPGRAQGGLGIGLTLVRSFVEMHGGTVAGASEGLGKGSRFTVRLPLLADVAAEREAAAGGPERATAPGVRSRRILIVEDSRDVAESLSGWLEDEGHQVRIAWTGAEALEAAGAFRPEVVFVDIGLPDMNGHDVARKLRDMPAAREAILVALTGYGQEGDQRRSREAGFDHHWIKPLTLENLSELLSPVGGAISPTSPTSPPKNGRRR